LRQQRSGGGV